MNLSCRELVCFKRSFLHGYVILVVSTFCFTQLLILSVDAALLDNYIIGVPKVLCEEDTVSLDIITTRPFKGHIFVKGRAKDSSCKQSYAHTGKNHSNAYSLPLGKCGMQRLRSANPRGINFGVTVVVSFHPDGFITKNDRAFHVRCFYMEPDEVVTSSLEVSQLPTQQVSDSIAMPTCEYSVHSGRLDGPSLTYANVGETISVIKTPQPGVLIAAFRGCPPGPSYMSA